MTFIEKLPDPIDLMAFFESEPFFSNEIDHHYGYVYTDSNGMKLIFSYAALEGWLQTIIEFNGEKISQHLSEGVSYFEIKNEIKGEYLSSDISFGESVTRMEIRLKPYISVQWNTLVR